jgi:hypothetical protein
MSGARAWWGPAAIASAILAGALNASGTHSPVRLGVTLWFLLVCPGMALVRLLALDDAAAELALAVALSIALAAAAGGILLYSGRWSPGTTLAILIAITVTAAAAPLARAHPLPRTTPWRRS